MRYRRLSVGRLGPLAALMIVTGVAGGAWFAADWRNRPSEIKDVSSLPPLDQALLDTLAKDRPDLKSALPGFGNNPPLAMLRQQLTAVVKDDLANLAEIANIQAALQLAKAEAENQRVRQTLAALELEKLRAAQTGLPEAGTAPAALPAAPPPSPGQSSSSEPAGTQPAAAALAGVTPSTNVAPHPCRGCGRACRGGGHTVRSSRFNLISPRDCRSRANACCGAR